MPKLFSAACIALPLPLLLGGCGSESPDLSARDSQALSTLSAGAPVQGQVVGSAKVVFSGRSSANAGSTVGVSATDGRLVVHTCTTTVRSDQTWSCTQQLGDGGYTWTAQAAGFTSAGIDFVVRSKGLAAPTIDQTPSPTKDSSPVLTGTASVYSKSSKHDHGNHSGSDNHRDGDREDDDDDDDDDDSGATRLADRQRERQGALLGRERLQPAVVVQGLRQARGRVASPDR